MANLYRPLTRLLEEAGVYFQGRGRGSHEKWFSPITERLIVVPSNIEKPHTANDILKDAGLPKAF